MSTSSSGPGVYSDFDSSLAAGVVPQAAGARSAIASPSVKVKVSYGLGALTESIKSFSIGLFLLFFYTTVLGLPGTWLGVATALGLIWDSTIDPIIGHLSDRSRARVGRRHGFMLIGALCTGASFVAVFSPPAGLSSVALFSWLLLASLFLRTTQSIFMVPYYALGAELTQDYEERTSVSAYRAASALVGTLVAAGVAYAVFSRGDAAAQEAARFDAGEYGTMAVVLGSVMTIAGLVATAGTWRYRKSGTRDGAVSTPRQAPSSANISFRTELISSLRDESFRALVLSASLFFLASVVNASLALHYLTYYAGIPGNGAFSLFQLAFGAGALLGVQIWVRVARHVEKRRLYFFATLATASLMVAAYVFVGEGRALGTGNLLALQCGNALAGMFASALWVLAPSMLADVAGLDSVKSGRRREGMFFGLYSQGQQMAAGVAILIAGTLVDVFAGLVPGQVYQSPMTIERIGLLYAGLPAALLVVAALVILKYNITARSVASAPSGW